jgi:hypothetical protein
MEQAPPSMGLLRFRIVAPINSVPYVNTKYFLRITTSFFPIKQLGCGIVRKRIVHFSFVLDSFSDSRIIFRFSDLIHHFFYTDRNRRNRRNRLVHGRVIFVYRNTCVLYILIAVHKASRRNDYISSLH